MPAQGTGSVAPRSDRAVSAQPHRAFGAGDAVALMVALIVTPTIIPTVTPTVTPTVAFADGETMTTPCAVRSIATPPTRPGLLFVAP
ncbi:hypothetical protein [Pandoraea oxalativorans]|uniref:hypothetical protein n=1 Tax=Pandoraea oxalativorans TaxID=573737 RepID=UPI0012F4B5A7|nr:hypothetical protein [Pandoraea oxalativorans]